MLPKVTKETNNVILYDIRDPGYISDILQQIKRENPVIAGMINGVCAQYINSERPQPLEKPMMPVEAAISLAALVYRQLGSQAEADLLNKQLIFDD